MTGGFRSVPTMRPNHCWIVLSVSILAGLLLSSNADSEDSDCETELKVRRKTIYDATVGQELRINCNVNFCRNNPPPTISWFKISNTNDPLIDSSSHIRTDWKVLNQSAGISLLIFKHILSSDSGQYQCRGGESVSHAINVYVHENGELSTATWKNETTTKTPEPPGDFWLYVYAAAGIVGFVISVIVITVVSMKGCKGRKNTETQAHNQYMEIPMTEQRSSQPPSRGSPSTPSSRRSTQRKPEPSQPSETTAPKDNNHLYGKIREDRRKRNAVEDEASSVVYAALNHQLPPRAAARPMRPQDECSEYAAIRVP